MSSNYPDGMSRSDYEHVEGSDLDLLFERWFEQNEDDLKDEFYESGWLEDDMGGVEWDKFVKHQFDRYVQELADGPEDAPDDL